VTLLHYSLTDRLTLSLTDQPLVNCGFLPRHLFFVVAVAYSQWWDISSMAAKSIFITELNNGIITGQVYFNNDFEWLSFTWQFELFSPWVRHFLNSDISQGSVATFVRCGGIFNVDFIVNLLESLSVKELWKSVSIWRSYWQKCGYPFLLDHPCTCLIIRVPACRNLYVAMTATVQPLHAGTHIMRW